MIVRARKPRRGGKRAEQREASRLALMNAARKLLASDGIENVSVQDIAREAGLSASLINVHFGGKGELLYAVVTENNAHQVKLARAAIEGRGTAIDKLAALVRIYAEADLADPRLLASMQAYSWTWPSETEVDNARQRRVHEDIIAETVREGIARGEFRNLDIDRTVTSLWAIYTWGLRSAVYQAASPAECADRILAQARDLLLA